MKTVFKIYSDVNSQFLVVADNENDLPLIGETTIDGRVINITKTDLPAENCIVDQNDEVIEFKDGEQIINPGVLSYKESSIYYSIIGYNKNDVELGYWTNSSDEFTSDPVNFGTKEQAENEISRAMELKNAENEYLGIKFKLSIWG
jgi:hypothetical protein